MDYENLESYTFTYPEWKIDVKECKRLILEDQPGMARNLFVGMTHKQRLHEGRCFDPTIMRMNSGEFTYPGFEEDREMLLQAFLEGKNTLYMIEKFEFNQMTHVGDRSHPILQKIDNTTYTYDGWEDDMERIISSLFTLNSLWVVMSPCESARAIFTCMDRKQLVFDKNMDDPFISLLYSDKFTYPNFSRDRDSLLEIYGKGCSINVWLNFIQLRQSIHVENYSHPVLEMLEMIQFSYKNWEHDYKTTRDFILSAKIDPRQAFYTPVWNARKKLESMQIKQRIHDRRDGTTYLLNSGLFNYEGFKQEKERFMESYVNDGCFLERNLEHMVLKQKVHLGENSNSFLSKLDYLLVNNDPQKQSAPKENEMDKSSEQVRKETEEDRIGRCIVCLEQPRTNAVVPCGHVALCEECAKLPQFSKRLRKFKCPVCRKKSDMVIKVYF